MQAIHQSKVWRIFQVASGNFLESYDVVIFAYFAPSIGRAYFPSESEFATIMATFMTFGLPICRARWERYCWGPISIITVAGAV